MPGRAFKIVGVVALILVVLAAGFAAWLSFGKPSDLKTKAYRALPFPAVMVGGKTILAKDYMHRIDIAKKTLPPESGVTEEEIKTQVYDRMIDEQKASLLAGEKGLEVKDSEVSDQYQDTVDQLTAGNEEDFKKMLEQYGMDQSEFRNQVLRPDLVFTKLVVWYNSQRDLNSGIYAKVDEVNEKLKDASTTFESLVQEYSSGQQQATEGDLGFVEVSKLLPEFKENLNEAQAGTTKVIPSRFGIHFFKIEDVDNHGENGSQRVHLKQILFEPQGFEQWYKNETKDYKVRRFIKI